MPSSRIARAYSTAADDPIAAAVAGTLLPVAIYLAFWKIHWNDDPEFSLLPYLVRIGFCIVVPSIIGTFAALILRVFRESPSVGTDRPTPDDFDQLAAALRKVLAKRRADPPEC